MDGSGYKTIHVTAAFIENDGRVLICRRKMKDGNGGKWEFPGGKVEPGETKKACLERELKEELSLTAAAGNEIARVRHEHEGKTYEITFFEAVIAGGELRLSEHTDAAWVKREELGNYDLMSADTEFVRFLLE
ncbi:MAG: CTP pyrophosphohydrolase [Firmicutes bacterium ADurb.Bin182]|nr:MAG: CTP pyrophosphohydrolase [Firmicutes bacterium ADurb.Bin182]